MWKKQESEQPETIGSSLSNLKPQPAREKAIIGPSLLVKGDVSGDEDLIIQGEVEGKVILKNHSLTVGKNGRIKADLYAKMIAVEGAVQGNLYGQEQIVVRQSGNVKGNLVSPRVTIEDGAKFKGSIDMDSAENLAARAGGGRPDTMAAKGPGVPSKEGAGVSAQSGQDAAPSHPQPKV